MPSVVVTLFFELPLPVAYYFPTSCYTQAIISSLVITNNHDNCNLATIPECGEMSKYVPIYEMHVFLVVILYELEINGLPSFISSKWKHVRSSACISCHNMRVFLLVMHLKWKQIELNNLRASKQEKKYVPIYIPEMGNILLLITIQHCYQYLAIHFPYSIILANGVALFVCTLLNAPCRAFNQRQYLARGRFSSKGCVTSTSILQYPN